MINKFDSKTREALFEYILQLADDNLIFGHRLSEWCGHAPILEEDVALANIALDCIGQASAFYSLAAELDGQGKNEDDFAFFRNENQFKNLLLAEQPNIDFAYTIARQFFYDAFAIYFYNELSKSHFEPLAGIATKAVKEINYHLRHCKTWMLRLGDGTDESNCRLQKAVDDLWMFTSEMFLNNYNDEILLNQKLIPDASPLFDEWFELVSNTFSEAKIKVPDRNAYQIKGGRKGFHTEHLGHLLAEMQIVARSFPKAKW
ncbi:1,2-phenylacetyl-CoA epoxidase subunit PaaC [Melioribacteraceae bacterium 4301-Me]|uniref:1,2-phenylacetyl-CoA epoxidase subunit PaaC n=1 Tax=Pyranulibacter aquaticus TaxID=3163344 RepID=UPI003594E577